MTEQLIILACVLSVFQPTKERLAIGITVSFSCVIHFLLCDDLPGITYYMSAALFDFIVLAFICSYARPSAFAENMIYICITSILLNVYGWVIYEMYFDPISYNLAFQGLYLAIIYILVKKDREHESDISDRSSFFRMYSHKFRALCGALSQEEKL